MSGERRSVMRGIGASPGIAVGTSLVIGRHRQPVLHTHIEPGRVAAEVQRLRGAVERSRAELASVRDRLGADAPADYRLILDAHMMMSRDDLLIDGAIAGIQQELVCAEWAVERSVASIRAHLRQAPEGYIRERAQDVDQVGQRIIEQLVGRTTTLPPMADGDVLVIHDLHPADAAQLLHAPIAALVTGLGSATSHTAILARTLEIPAVVGVADITEVVGVGDRIIVDSLHARVVLDPPDAECEQATAWANRYRSFMRRLRAQDELPATRDGVDVQLLANVDLPAEAAMAVDARAQGIGLYRTEFLYMSRAQAPTEDEQLKVYREMASAVGERSVVLRTVDMGGDNLTIPDEAHDVPNPALGLRAIRAALSQPAVFRTQLRAVLRAATVGKVRVMFPLISGVAEFEEACACLEQARQELVERGDAFGQVEVGAMIELPSAVWMADQLARRCDFLSVGTNDLVQYTLGVDRTNPDVAYLGDALHPAVLRQLRHVVQAAAAHGRDLSMCGDMAADLFALPIVIGLGFRRLSVPVSALPLVREVVRHVDAAAAEEVAGQALRAATVGDVRRLVSEAFEPELGPIWIETGVLEERVAPRG